ncbi:hypothetical protein [Streptomyces sp. NBC_00063]
MSTTVKAFGARNVRQPLAPLTGERRDVGPHDVSWTSCTAASATAT